METLEFSFVSKGQSSHLTIPPQTRAKFWVCTNLLRGLRAKSERLYPAEEPSGCIFAQEKCYLSEFSRIHLF